MIESGEQRMSYRATEEVIVDDDGRRWVREGAATLPSWADGVPVPRDKDGNVIPLATRTLYDVEGNEHEVKEITLVHFETSGGFMWLARQSDGEVLVPGLLHLERPDIPDSWECVEADFVAMARADCACYYFGAGADLNCEECPAENCAESCFAEAFRDVMRRCKAIAERDAND